MNNTRKLPNHYKNILFLQICESEILKMLEYVEKLEVGIWKFGNFETLKLCEFDVLKLWNIWNVQIFKLQHRSCSNIQTFKFPPARKSDFQTLQTFKLNSNYSVHTFQKLKHVLGQKLARMKELHSFQTFEHLKSLNCWILQGRRLFGFVDNDEDISHY